jgi:hypothetical protein
VREEARLRVQKMFIYELEELREEFKKFCVVRSFMICTVRVSKLRIIILFNVK